MAVNVYHQYVNDTNDIETPTIVVSTASPYKFADSVLSAVAKDYSPDVSEFTKIKELSAITEHQFLHQSQH